MVPLVIPLVPMVMSMVPFALPMVPLGEPRTEPIFALVSQLKVDQNCPKALS